MKNQKGITLIALIITIIVMLILVGVSVSVALNTGLFKAAQGAAKNTEGARINETKLSEGQIQKEDGTWVDIKEYVNSFNTKSLDLTGEIGTKVNYSAGGVTDWRIYEKDETAGTVTLLGKANNVDWANITSEEVFNSYIQTQYIDTNHADKIVSVSMIPASDFFEWEWVVADLNQKRTLSAEVLASVSLFGLKEDYYVEACTTFSEYRTNGIRRWFLHE